MRRYLGLVLACALAAISASVLAMGLGEIRLNSYLNQRLDAEIELVSAAADEIESLEISLAAPSVFERYGLERTALLNSLQFRVVRRPNGTAYVKVTSSEPIREPFLTLLVVADWSRGRLMREYTLLIDPPTFAGQEQAAPQVQVPAQPVTPLPQGGEPVISREPAREPQVEPAPSEEVRGDVITIPPLEADAEQVAPIRREPAQAEPELGGNYGPIQRNETLWGIAQRLRPDESVTINQMMLALYRANPEAFQGNINRLKAGYILRIPDYSEISSLARRDAFNEVKRQNEEWRAGSRAPAPPSVDVTEQPVEAEPELSLVAPEEDIPVEDGLGVGAGGESGDVALGTEDPLELAEDDVDQDAVDLGIEEESADRLLDVEDESLQALQEQEALQEQDGLTESGEAAEEVTQEPAELPPLPDEQAETVEEPVVGETEETVEPATEGQQQAETTEPQPVQERPAVVPEPVREPGLVEKLTNFVLSPLGLGIAAAVLVLLLAGALVVRKRRDAEKGRAAAAMAEWEDTETDSDTVITFDEDETAAARDTDDVATVFAHGMEHEDTGTTQLDEDSATQMLERPSSKAPVDFTETVVGGQQAVTLDDNDPLSEADFHMAYGLYDQAAEVVQKAVERDPSRKDYLAKLAEIHFAGNDTEGFLDAARRLKALAGPGDPDWDNVAIMGQQIAPNDELFATRGSTASVDLDFGSAAEEFGEAAPSEPAPVGDDLDFDLEADAGEPVAAAADDSLDFDLDLGSLETSSDETAQPDIGSGEPAADDDFDFDLGELDATASDDDTGQVARGSEQSFNDEQTQTEFDKALEELSAFVDTNLPEQDAGDAISADDDSAKLNLDDYSFDEDAGSLEDELASGGEDEEDIGEIGTKLDLARAYIDMGDPDGARGILEEVLSDGDADQQKEARELLDQLS